MFSKYVLGGCFTFLIKMWSHVATLREGLSASALRNSGGTGPRALAGRCEHTAYAMHHRARPGFSSLPPEEFSGSELGRGFGSSLP